MAWRNYGSCRLSNSIPNLVTEIALDSMGDLTQMTELFWILTVSSLKKVNGAK